MKKVSSTLTLPSKLTLRKENIRVLSSTELHGVVGGEPTTTGEPTPSTKTTNKAP